MACATPGRLHRSHRRDRERRPAPRRHDRDGRPRHPHHHGGRTRRGVELADGRALRAGTVVSTADLHHTESALLAPEERSYPEKWWDKREPSPGALLLLLGVRGELPSSRTTPPVQRGLAGELRRGLRRASAHSRPGVAVRLPSQRDGSRRRPGGGRRTSSCSCRYPRTPRGGAEAKTAGATPPSSVPRTPSSPRSPDGAASRISRNGSSSAARSPGRLRSRLPRVARKLARPRAHAASERDVPPPQPSKRVGRAVVRGVIRAPRHRPAHVPHLRELVAKGLRGDTSPGPLPEPSGRRTDVRGLYLAAILLSTAGVLALDLRLRLALRPAPLRTLAATALGTAFFLAWDLAGIAAGVFVKGDSPLWSASTSHPPPPRGARLPRLPLLPRPRPHRCRGACRAPERRRGAGA